MNFLFWKNKRVLLTGHTGFKGSWLGHMLKMAGASVIGYSLEPPSEPNLFDILKSKKDAPLIGGDIRNLNGLKRIITETQPDILIHMAAQALVRPSYKNPVDTYSTNVMGTVNVLEAVRCSNSVRVALMVTSDKCYENKERINGYRENDPMGGYDPYSSSKGCAELVVSAYRNSFFNNETGTGVSLASVRAGNVIGGGDWGEDRLIPDIIRAFAKKQTVAIRNPNAVRPWQHVLEPLNGYLILSEKLWEQGSEFCGGWNFGADEKDTREVQWIAQFLARLWGGGASWECDANQHPHEAKLLALDCSKAKWKLGWKPKLTLEQTLEWTLEWYRKYYDRKDMISVTEKQIDTFLRI